YSGRAAQYQGTAANAASDRPQAIKHPSTTKLNENRRRKRPASSEKATEPAPEAANKRPSSKFEVCSRSFAYRTACAVAVAFTKLNSIIISEMLRSTGWRST